MSTRPITFVQPAGLVASPAFSHVRARGRYDHLRGRPERCRRQRLRRLERHRRAVEPSDRQREHRARNRRRIARLRSGISISNSPNRSGSIECRHYGSIPWSLLRRRPSTPNERSSWGWTRQTSPASPSTSRSSIGVCATSHIAIWVRISTNRPVRVSRPRRTLAAQPKFIERSPSRQYRSPDLESTPPALLRGAMAGYRVRYRRALAIASIRYRSGARRLWRICECRDRERRGWFRGRR